METASSVFKDYISTTVDGVDIIDPLSTFFISPSKTYMSSLFTSNNGTVHAVLFVQQ
jgi:hypothetical protein